MGGSTADSVMIGDTIHDAMGAVQAGIPFIAVTYGYDKKENLINAKPTLIIDDFSELKDIIEKK